VQAEMFATQLEPAKGAVLSPDGRYRYQLWRTWDGAKAALGWVMLNPSTADASDDDPTIRRCISRAKAEGYGGILVCNLYAYRTPSPAVMWDAERKGIDIVGPENDSYLKAMWVDCDVVVAAWGAGARPGRVAEV